MGLIENDPRNTAYIALLIAIKWYKYIEPEAAWRIALGKSSAKKGNKLTPETQEQIYKMVFGPTFRSFNVIEKKYKINRYDIIQSEEEVIMSQVKMAVTRVKEAIKDLSARGEKCTASNCESCVLNAMTSSGQTLCEIFCDIEFDEHGNPVYAENQGVRKSAIKCDFTGEPIKRGIELYKDVDAMLEQYKRDHKGKKVRDIINLALAEYISRHK
jgi:hypothetical protein